MGTRARVTTVAGAATLLCAASTLGGGFAALAAPSTVPPPPVQASAPLPVLVGSCGDTVRGTPGQGVGVRVASLPAVNVGQVPASGSTTYDATPALRGPLGPVAPGCNITAEAIPVISPIIEPVGAMVAPALAPAQGAVGVIPALSQPSSPGAPSSPPPSVPAEQPQPAAAPSLANVEYGPSFGPFMPGFPYAMGLYSSGLPHFNYADLLAIGRPSGALGRLSAGMLTADLFGTQSVSNGSGLGKQSAAANDVAAAGRASALPASGVERIALPVLVAVLMLASVSAALLRSWVLGRR
jgi:hypothetical protein